MQPSKITETKIKEHAVSSMVLIGMYAVPLGFAIYFLLGNVLHIFDNQTLVGFVSFSIGFCIPCYILLNKFFSALAYDASIRGVSDEIKQKHDGK